jgi:predicted deacylase
MILLVAGILLALSNSACALPPTSASAPARKIAAQPGAQASPPAELPTAAPRPSATALNSVTLPEVVVPADTSTRTAVVTQTAVFQPTATSDLPSPTPVPTATLSPTATREARRGGLRIVRDALPDGVYCPVRETHVRSEAQLVGRSAVCDLPILSYRLGEGEKALVLVGGIHGGYEWNTVVLAENMLKHLRENAGAIPEGVSVYIIPDANPDGLYRVMGRDAAFQPPEDFSQTVIGRFNGRDVDLNRNWDCQWQSEALWGSEVVSGGSAPFSEPETQALRDFFLELRPAAVLFWHSAAVGVYPAGCGESDAASAEIAQLYGEAAGYDVYEGFGNYEVTGDAGDWLTTQGIPAITVELSTHSALDWEENLAGLEALIAYLSGDEN